MAILPTRAERREFQGYNIGMETKRFIYYEEDGYFIGWLEDYPDYRTQGRTMEELREHLVEIFNELTCGEIPCVRKVGELTIP